jgi:phospholipid/cholesterol/gamma-HCH transport system substrate-binding protein
MTETADAGGSPRVRRAIGSLSMATKLITLGVVVALIVVAAVVLLSSSSNTVVALFPQAAAIYPGDRVKILGVDVGSIDKIEPSDKDVKVTMSVGSKYKVPANAGAVIVSPTLVATRFVQLTPVYSGGPVMASGSVIPMDRTTSPMEFDALKQQLDDLSTALGPNGVNKNGSLSRALDTFADNADGQGARFKNTLAELTKATDTLNQGRGNLFGTVRNLQVFVSALAANDQQLVDVNNNLASVTGTLADSRQDLDGALVEFNRLAPLVQQFFDKNRSRIVETTDRAGQVARNLSGVRDDLSLALLVAGPAIQNFYNIFSNNAFTGGLAVPNLRSPAQLVCGAIGALEPNKATADQLCSTALGPILQAVATPGLPAGISPLGSVGSGAAAQPAPAIANLPSQLLPVPGAPAPGAAAPAAPALPGVLPNLGGGN